jgi:hypothetical protein
MAGVTASAANIGSFNQASDDFIWKALDAWAGLKTIGAPASSITMKSRAITYGMQISPPSLGDNNYLGKVGYFWELGNSHLLILNFSPGNSAEVRMNASDSLVLRHTFKSNRMCHIRTLRDLGGPKNDA